jgi:hypothetical protein
MLFAMGEERVTRFWALARVDEPQSSMTCDLFNTGAGLEVRCHCGEVVLHSERVGSVADAMNFCEAWKASYRGQGWNELLE